MNRTTKLKSTSVALALALPLATPVLYADAQTAPNKKPNASAQKSAPFIDSKVQDREWHFVVSAEDLIGSPVYDSNEERAGNIEYMMIGMDGAVDYVVLSELNSSDDLRALPWSAFDTPVSRTAARLNVSKDKVEKSYKVDRNDLVELTKPSVFTTITDYWAPLERRNGSDNAAQNPDRESADRDASQSGTNTNDGVASSRSSKGNSSEAKAGTDGTQQAEPQDKSVPHILIGRDTTSVLVEPRAQFAQDFLNAEVQSSDGKEIGQLDHLMIETSVGRVAYALISEGGFLGFDEKWRPVPFEALAWSPQSESFTLQANASDLKTMKSFGKTERPGSVRESDLAKLYKQYDVQPFWSEHKSVESSRQGKAGADVDPKS